MNYLGLTLVLIIGLVGTNSAAETETSQALSLTLAVPKDSSGASTIDRQRAFQVVIRNRSEKPIRLWNRECQLGYESVYFQVAGAAGRPSSMAPRTLDGAAWSDHPPKTFTLSPGEIYYWDVGLDHLAWGDRKWERVPEPNSGKSVSLTAVLEIKSNEAAKQHGVWVGRVTSEPQNVVVVDAKLRTPHDYLWNGFPESALRIMKADLSWIRKRDNMRHTPLHLAARFGNTEVARWLLENGADIEAEAINQFRPLTYTEHPEIVKLLLEHKADVNAKSSGGTALEKATGQCARLESSVKEAATYGNWRTITKLLLAAGAEYDLYSATCLNDVERVRVLLADKKAAHDKDALRAAARYGRTAILKLMLENGAEPEDAGFGGLTLSHCAIEHADALKVLFDAGADPKVRVTYRGNGGPEDSTLLHEAAAKGCIDSAKLLLSLGLDVNAVDPNGMTPLHAACSSGQAAMVEFLLEHHANARATMKNKLTPLGLATFRVQHNESSNPRFFDVIRALERAGVEVDVFAAIARNDVEKVKKLLEADAKVSEATDSFGYPALHQAVAFDGREIVKLLLEKIADPDFRSQSQGRGTNGETALIAAASWGRLEIAEILIARGANVNAKDAKGTMALHEAARCGNFEVARLLIAHGAEVNAKDSEGKTALAWAGAYEEASNLKALLQKHGGKK